MATIAGDERRRPPVTAGRPRTRLDPERRREQLLDAAESVFEGRNPLDVTFEQVADAAGVSRALVYNYFGDKFGLITAVYLRWAVDLDLELSVAIASDDPPEDRFRRIIRAHLDFAARHGAVAALVQSGEGSAHPAANQARLRRIERLAHTWGPTAEDRLLGRGVLALLERVALDRLDDPVLDRATVEDLVFALVWPGLAGRNSAPFA